LFKWDNELTPQN